MERKEFPLFCSEQRNIESKLHAELIVLSQRPVGGDQVFRGFAEGLHEVLHSEEPAAEAFEQIVRERIGQKEIKNERVAEEQVAYVARLIFNTLQFHYWGPGSQTPEYPYDEKYEDSSYWRTQLTQLFSSDSLHRDKLLDDIRTRELMSNVGQRYITLKLITKLEGHRWNYEPDVLDIGSSVMIGDKKLFAKGPAGLFDPPSVRKNQKDESGKYSLVENQLSDIMADIAMDEYVVREGARHFGVDKISVLDENALQWARSNSFYPREIKEKPNLIKAFDEILLQGREPDMADKLVFVPADFTKPQTELFNGKKFDIIFVSTMLYQMVPEERRMVFWNARQMLSDNGILIIQDGAELNRNDPDWLDFSAEKFHEYFQCRTYVYDKSMQDRGLQQFIKWENMRCRQMVFSESRFALEAIQKLRRLG